MCTLISAQIVLNIIVDIMCTNSIEYYCRHDVHKVRCDEEEKINRVNTMTMIETISWSKTSIFTRICFLYSIDVIFWKSQPSFTKGGCTCILHYNTYLKRIFNCITLHIYCFAIFFLCKGTSFRNSSTYRSLIFKLHTAHCANTLLFPSYFWSL